MDDQNGTESAERPWYEEGGVIDHRFYGVFEGGGAKGVAYSGALLAMAKKRCWFRGVAGASAGAITAALVACGHTPEEFEGLTVSALERLQTGVWAGLKRLKNAAGYFPSKALESWIEERLRAQVARYTGVEATAPVTFRQLYDATGIELNVVAADLSQSCQVVFSHHDTPDCAVSRAVVASCSIPFAFASHLLQVPDGESFSHHTVVDGGVWSNFPMHIFEDPAFRAYSERSPTEIDPREILGFLLDEEGGHPPPRGDGVAFVDNVPMEDFRAPEWTSGGAAEVDAQPSFAATAAAWLLMPFSLLGQLLQWNAKMGSGRWPKPQSKLARNLVNSIDGLLGGTHSLLWGALVCVIVGLGVWQVLDYIVGELNILEVTNWKDPMVYPARLFLLVLASLGTAIALLTLFATILFVAINFLLLRTSRRILYGLITTYVAGSGAPAWVAGRENVIPLPIPRSITTLSFKMKPKKRTRLIETAEKVTCDRLTTLL